MVYEYCITVKTHLMRLWKQKTPTKSLKLFQILKYEHPDKYKPKQIILMTAADDDDVTSSNSTNP